MSEKQPLVEYSFTPDLVRAMRVAFLRACEAPQVREVGGATRGSVAEHILELASARETSAEELCARALRRFEH